MANDATVRFGYDGTALNRGLAQQEGKLKGFASSTERSFRGAQAAIGALGLGYLAREAVQVVTSFDRMQRGMTSLEGSAAGAKQRMDELREASKLPGLDFEQAVQGDIRLRSVGISAELSKKALVEMGNALSLAGGTAADLDGVVLALTQIVSKGKVSAEEINQIAERVPQVRAVMQDMFGTADTETLQRMNIDAETFVSTLVEGFGKLQRAQAGLDEKLNDFTTSIRTAATALLEGLVGQGADGLSRLGGLLDANNDKLRETGSLLGNAASGAVEFVAGFGQGIGEAIGYTKQLADSLLETGGINQFEESLKGIQELKKAAAENLEIEKQQTAQIEASNTARKKEVESMTLPPSVLDNEDPITKAGKEMDKPASKAQQALDERKRKLAEEELPVKERIAAIEERISAQKTLVENAAITLNLTDEQRIANEMKLLDLQEQAAALKRREEKTATASVPTASVPTASSAAASETRGSMPGKTNFAALAASDSARAGERGGGKAYAQSQEEGYDAEGRRLSDGRRKIKGVKTADTYQGGSLSGRTGSLSQGGPLTKGGGIAGFNAMQRGEQGLLMNRGASGINQIYNPPKARGGVNTSGAAAAAATTASRGDDLGSKLDLTNQLLSKVLLGN